MSIIARFLLISFCITLIAWGDFPENPPLKKYDSSKGYRFDNLELGDKNTDSLFVVVTFSGGGTRAAALSYGVLNALNQTSIVWENQNKSLLDEVDIISSVSGGSFTAAYYGLHRQKIFDGTYEREFLKKDIEEALTYSLFSPTNLINLAGGSYGRSDLATKYYNEHLFHGATYTEIEAQKQRPFVILNTTDMTKGTQFPFIQDQFDLICSDMSKITIARAVASSSAFPGLLTPLTFKNHAGTCHYDPPVWVELAKGDWQINPERAKRAEDRESYYMMTPSDEPMRTYIHLMDGGVSDNLGLRGILYAMTSTDPSYSIIQKINLKKIKKLVVIVVNAATAPKSKYDTSPNVPAVTEVLKSAVSVPLDNYSFDTLKRLQQIAKQNESYQDRYNSCNNLLQQICPGKQISEDKPYSYDFYLVQVAFDFITDKDKRQKFKNLPTTFSLPGKTVDDLNNIGRKLLQEAPDLKSFKSSLPQTKNK